MQNVKNFFQGKALGVAEYLTPILKVVFKLPEWVMVFINALVIRQTVRRIILDFGKI